MGLAGLLRAINQVQAALVIPSVISACRQTWGGRTYQVERKQ